LEEQGTRLHAQIEDMEKENKRLIDLLLKSQREANELRDRENQFAQ
jgi:hypothetical protein